MKRCVVCGAVIPMFHADGRKVRRDRLTCCAAHKKERQRWDENHAGQILKNKGDKNVE